MEGNLAEQNLPPPKEGDKNRLLVSSVYTFLKAKEESPADPKDKIFIGSIEPTDSEFTLLTNSGVTQEELNGHSVTREKLLKAGFIFNNCPLFPIEKPLINVTIDGVNYGKRKLLTNTELDRIRSYQRSQPELYGGEEISSDEFRLDMMSFLLSANTEIPIEAKNKVNFVNIALNYMDSGYVGLSHKDRYENNKTERRAAKYYKQLVGEFMHSILPPDEDNFMRQVEYINNNFADILPWEFDGRGSSTFFDTEARDHKMSFNKDRFTKLSNSVSPFLDCGFKFSDLGNPDYEVIESNGKRFRVNMMVLHLLSRGISEMGEGVDGKGEQDYCVGNYERELFVKDSQTRHQNHETEQGKYDLTLAFDQEALLIKVMDRLKSRALEWASSSDANGKVKELAAHIKRIETGKETLKDLKERLFPQKEKDSLNRKPTASRL